MSTPFAIFRKNQTFWMAGLVLLSLLAFVVAPAIETASQAFRGATGDEAVVVKWEGGLITVADLNHNTQKHGNLVRFLNSLAEEVVAAGGVPQVPGFEYDPQTRQIVGLGIQSSTNQLDICRGRILATEAERLGITFSDDSIDEFIRLFCDRKITNKRLAEILQESTSGRLSNFDLREMLKRELSALVVGQIARAGIYAQPPGKTFRDFEKLNQTAKVEAFPVFVDQYISQVTGEPTEAEIQTIYQAGSQSAPDPTSPNPGFVRRYQANVEYVEANLTEWTERAKADITEEQLREEYEQRKLMGRLQVPVTEDEGDAGTAEAPAAETPATEATTAEEAATPSQPAAEEPSAVEAPAAETQSTETPAAETPASDEQSRAGTRGTAVRLVNFVQSETAPGSDLPPPVVQPPQLGQDAANAAAEAAEASEPANATEEAAPAADKAPAEAEAPQTPGAADEPAETPEDASTEAAAAEVASPSEADPNAPGLAADAEAAAEEAAPAMRDQTFEEAREEILESLARDAASPAMQQALEELVNKHMNPYYAAYRQYEAFSNNDELADKDEEESRTPPARPDIKKIATELGLKYVETGMVDITTLSQTQFGGGPVNGDGLSGTVAENLMTPQLLELFRPVQSIYYDQQALMTGGNFDFLQFISWKTAERLPYAPELPEVRDEVVDAWKRQQARVLASAAASVLAKKVTTGESAWQAALDTNEQALVVQTAPFTWMTRFNEYIMPSNVPTLDTVGTEFMRAVFSAKVGQPFVAPNQPQSAYYVTRVLEFAPSEQELQERFNADPTKSGPLGIARQEVNETFLDWYQNLERRLGVEWQINPGSIN
ncbi:SurA N-terminal domain-containing protein [Aureliella helgolandensis]|uniref:Periplasmic folding chaperone n=1 Tax=Aureliella helgolandensis TaxID=2527968 RepID=A0A518G336_9BACT|nr:hypothetical protein [Aureliella helgolandensis]QDV22970.1 hypothetical protein Q31a_12630 [Aureliella helgolandensis]